VSVHRTTTRGAHLIVMGYRYTGDQATRPYCCNTKHLRSFNLKFRVPQFFNSPSSTRTVDRSFPSLSSLFSPSCAPAFCVVMSARRILLASSLVALAATGTAQDIGGAVSSLSGSCQVRWSFRLPTGVRAHGCWSTKSLPRRACWVQASLAVPTLPASLVVSLSRSPVCFMPVADRARNLKVATTTGSVVTPVDNWSVLSSLYCQGLGGRRWLKHRS
jgi:hypothetical protein